MAYKPSWTIITDYAGGLDKELDLSVVPPRYIPHLVNLHLDLEEARIRLGKREHHLHKTTLSELSSATHVPKTDT